MGPNGNGGGGGQRDFGVPPMNNNTSTADRHPDVDLPADESQYSPIDEAFDAMQADDQDPRPQGQPQGQPQTQARREFPQPVQPRQRQQGQPQFQQPQQRQPQDGRQGQQGQQRQRQDQSQDGQQQQQRQPAQPRDDRAERDPFGFQADHLEQQTDQYIDALAERVYIIADEDMDAFLSGDSKQVSRALARVHVNAVGSVMRAISQQMPVWVDRMLRYHQQATDHETAFWSANPGLDRAQHHDMAMAAARAFRQMNPDADAATMYKMVGAMVAAAAGLPGGAGQPRQQTHQTADGVRTPGRVVRRTGGAFSPAGTAPPGGPRRQTNTWDQITSIIQADDAGAFDNS